MASTQKSFNCFTLEIGVKTISTLELIISSTLLTFLTVVLFDICFGGKTANSIEYFLGVRRDLQFVSWYVCWIAVFTKLLLDANLFQGARAKSLSACQFWMIVNGSTLFVHYVWSLLTFNMPWPRQHCTTIIIANFVIGVFKVLEITLVYQLVKKIKANAKTSALIPTFVAVEEATLDLENQTSIQGLGTPSISGVECLPPKPKMHQTSEDYSLFTPYKVI